MQHYQNAFSPKDQKIFKHKKLTRAFWQLTSFRDMQLKQHPSPKIQGSNEIKMYGDKQLKIVIYITNTQSYIYSYRAIYITNS